MPTLEYFLVAEEVSIDQATNQLSLFNVLDALRTPGFPLLITKCCGVAVWRKEPEDEGRDFQCTFRITAPNNQNHQFETNFRMTNSRHRIINRIQGLPVLAVGEVRFELLLNGEHVEWHIVAVDARPPEEMPDITH